MSLMETIVVAKKKEIEREKGKEMLTVCLSIQILLSLITAEQMVHFSQSMMPDVPLATSLPTTFTFQQPTNQLDEQGNLQQQQQQQQQQQSLPSSSQSQMNSVDQQQRSASNDEGSNPNHSQGHPNDYETRLR